MLTQDIKRKIDSARQILVGKVPDPKAQVEQITLALIYKFMDDMDKQAMTLPKGRAQFFTNGYEQYAWNKLMDPRLGGQERLDLYVRSIAELSKNPHLPQLFRDIYKNAFLPFRDPATLTLFLKEINSFEYDHSENLGDAFEYLLSILGSQGDAGQFRTPRHIIDFIAAVVDPKKNETVLDPACGTAGFLISAYKHILAAHDGKNDPEHTEIPLTPDERKKLMTNLAGYDISPDMVKLSLVNLYLHGFPNPNIHEYDTLASEDRWDERFDVIMANPPFMSPKGGIRPHKRFSVQANRSEVLFVDYIMEHLNPKGRAGIIVPEGIIFQSAGAYKQLRKLLVEDGLYAVVSLPGGVFNPYSGVKTSILFFDKELAKKAKEILFIKIANDGFDLGAQRRPLKHSHLPAAIEILHLYKQHVLARRKIMFQSDDEFALLVPKEKISETEDYNLSGDKYRVSSEYINTKWPMVELGNICTFEYGKPLKEENRKGGEYPVFGSNGVVGWHNEYLVKGPLIIIGRKGTAGAVTFSEKSGYPIDTTFYIQLKDNSTIDQKFLYSVLRQAGLDKVNTQAGVPGLNRNDAYKIKIPLPPLEIQKEIVGQIEVKQQAIEHAKAIIQNLERERRYFGQSLRGLTDIKWLKLGDVCETSSGGTPLKSKREYYENGTVPWLKSGEVNQGYIYETEEKITQMGLKNSSAKIFPIDTVLVAMYGATAGKVGLLKTEASTNQAVCGVLPNDKVVPEFMYFYLRTKTDDMVRLSGGGAQPNISQAIIRNIEVPLIPIDTQKSLVADVIKEEEIITSNKKLVELMENKINEVLKNI